MKMPLNYFGLKIRRLTWNRILTLTVFLGAPGISFADCQNVESNIVVCLGVVKTVYLDTSALGLLFVQHGVIPPSLNCSSGLDPGWWAIPKSSSNYEEWSRMVNASALVGVPIYVVSTGAAQVGLPCTIERIELRN